MVAPTDHNLIDLKAKLRALGYGHGLLEENYRFADWFSQRHQEVEVELAAFGQTPVSYDTACIGVVRANGVSHQPLINRCRSLGAPVVLELEGDHIREWGVSRQNNQHALMAECPLSSIDQLFIERAQVWKPESLLRAKNICAFHRMPELGLFSGLIPELEEQIQSVLEPRLHSAMYATSTEYQESTGRDPSPAKLFKLVFWALTAKVFHDRRVGRFARLGAEPDAEEVIDAVAQHYGVSTPKLLNASSRRKAVESIWTVLDFRNLSVEILSHMWGTALLDDETKSKLSIHRTSRSIVRYVVDRIPFSQHGDDERIVFEPCSGSAAFLVGAMHALRNNLFGASPSERHKYFVSRLAGMEQDPFGVEISKLVLTLADFPNPDGWNIAHGDVFDGDSMQPFLSRAGVVLCNPPYSDFDDYERSRYSTVSHKKPVEVLHRVLAGLHPDGVLGFVLPRTFVDGKSYSSVRRQLAERFSNIHLTVLPDRAFDADSEISVVIATDPIPHDRCRVSFSRVNDDAGAWARFEREHATSSSHDLTVTYNEAADSLSVPELPEVWDFLVTYPTLGDISAIHRGIEWQVPLTVDGQETGSRSELVRSTPAKGFSKGVAPKTKLYAFETPGLKYLSTRPEDQRGKAYARPWHLPKVIVNKTARSRGNWRIAAFADTEGLVCYQTFTAIWPKEAAKYDVEVLSAILNSPVANAYVASRTGKIDIPIECFRGIPVPYLTEEQAGIIRGAVESYRRLAATPCADQVQLERLLMTIDAVVLSGFRMPPRLESKLLEYFRGSDRQARAFGDYVGIDDDTYFSLWDRLQPSFREATAGEFIKRLMG